MHHAIPTINRKRTAGFFTAIAFLALSGHSVFQPAATAQTVYEDYTFTTLAGPAGAAIWTDGPENVARFGAPSSVARDDGGNIFVADTLNHTIRKITPAGLVATLAGLAGVSGSADGTGAAARFNSPSGVAVDHDGNVYVADRGNHVIRKITPAGVVATLAGAAGISGAVNGTGSAARFFLPYGVAVDSNNILYVADTYNHTIRKITPAGVVTTLAGSAGNPGSADKTGTAASFKNPISLALGSDGNIYVADTANNTIRKISAAGAVTTLAGQAGASGSADGTKGAARFNVPYGVTVDGDLNVYVADTFNHTIRKITPAGVVTTPAGTAGSPESVDATGNAARFNFPIGIVVDNGMNLYIGDYSNGSIRKITPGAVVTTVTGRPLGQGSVDGAAGTARFNVPSDTEVDTNGNVYVADLSNHTIRKVTPAGEVTTIAGTAGSSGTNDGVGPAARFNQPTGLALDHIGNLYVADTLNHAIRKITPDGTVSTLAGRAGTSGTNDGSGVQARFNQPFSVAVDTDNNLYVGDTHNHAIRKITPAGEVTTLAGTIGVLGTNDGAGLAAKFSYPEGVAVDVSGNLYVTDNGNFTVRKITPAGVVTTFAGLAGSTGSTDGTGSAARFNYPFGMAVDTNGNLYIGDAANNSIRKITAQGVVTTLAGLAGNPGSSSGTGPDARFQSPYNLAVDTAGNVYVADAFNHSIRKGYPAPPDRILIDSATNRVDVTRHLGITNQTTTSWDWSLIRYPAASSAQLSSTNTTNPSFTPDVEDTYIVRFQGSDNSGHTTIRTLTVIADATAPNVNVTAPTPNQHWSNAVFTATGTAADNLAVAGVWYQLNNGPWTQASGTTNWTADAALTVGAHTIRAYALDTAGNASPTNSVSFTYVNSAPLTVQIIGGGAVTPNYNGQLLEIGQTYSMTASAASGFAFAGWTGSLTTNSPTLSFVMQSNLTFTANFVDGLSPTLTITSPQSGQRWSNAVFNITGTATDNGQVAGVWCRVNSGAWVPAVGTTNWTLAAVLTPGANTVQAYATDAVGNASPTNSATLTYVLSDRLTVVVAGQGTLTPDYNNAVLEIGIHYTMMAKPAANYVFSNWVDNAGNVLATGPVLDFTMKSNLVLQANFTPNPFLSTAGNYAGLFYNTNGVTPTSAGFFSGKVTSKGTFSAKLLLAGSSVSVSGEFSGGGVFSNSVARKGSTPLSVQLQLNLSGGDKITGLISDGASAWTAALKADRAVFSKTALATQAGSYTLVISTGGDASKQPAGYGFGTVTVSSAGGVSFKGTLGDGSKVAQKAVVSKDGQWPFYLPLYSGQGVMLGWLTFTTNQPESDLSGLVSWIKLSQPGVALYPGGFNFTNGLQALGSRFSFTSGVPLLDLPTGGVVLLEQGNLSQSITNAFSLGADNKVTGTNGIKVTIATKSGLFKGSVLNPAGGKSIPINGVLFLKQNAGFGSFLGTSQSGSVYLGP